MHNATPNSTSVHNNLLLQRLTQAPHRCPNYHPASNSSQLFTNTDENKMLDTPRILELLATNPDYAMQYMNVYFANKTMLECFAQQLTITYKKSFVGFIDKLFSFLQNPCRDKQNNALLCIVHISTSSIIVGALVDIGRSTWTRNLITQLVDLARTNVSLKDTINHVAITISQLTTNKQVCHVISNHTTLHGTLRNTLYALLENCSKPQASHRHRKADTKIADNIATSICNLFNNNSCSNQIISHTDVLCHSIAHICTSINNCLAIHNRQYDIMRNIAHKLANLIFTTLSKMTSAWDIWHLDQAMSTMASIISMCSSVVEAYNYTAAIREEDRAIASQVVNKAVLLIPRLICLMKNKLASSNNTAVDTLNANQLARLFHVISDVIERYNDPAALIEIESAIALPVVNNAVLIINILISNKIIREKTTQMNTYPLIRIYNMIWRVREQHHTLVGTAIMIINHLNSLEFHQRVQLQ